MYPNLRERERGEGGGGISRETQRTETDRLGEKRGTGHTHGSALLNLEAKMHFPAARTEEVTARQTNELVTRVVLSTHSAHGSATYQRILSKRSIETVTNTSLLSPWGNSFGSSMNTAKQQT